MNEQTEQPANERTNDEVAESSWLSGIAMRKNEENNQFNSIFSFDEWVKQGCRNSYSPIPFPPPQNKDTTACVRVLCIEYVVWPRGLCASAFFSFRVLKGLLFHIYAHLHATHPSKSPDEALKWKNGRSGMWCDVLVFLFHNFINQELYRCQAVHLSSNVTIQMKVVSNDAIFFIHFFFLLGGISKSAERVHLNLWDDILSLILPHASRNRMWANGLSPSLFFSLSSYQRKCKYFQTLQANINGRAFAIANGIFY